MGFKFSMKRNFCFIAGRCKTVIACRLAPVQKSQVIAKYMSFDSLS